MQTLKLTKQDFDAQNKYIGKTDVSDYQGHIEIEGGLGWVFFVEINITGFLWAKAGSGIKAGEGIKAGWGIKAGEGIEAGSGIEAGWGIEAGLYIICKLTLSSKLRIFAGLCIWKIPSEEEKTITCKKLVQGEIAYGILKELK